MIPRSECLRRILQPRSVAVIGATDRPGSVGAAMFANLRGGGFAGRIVPVSVSRPCISGVSAFRMIADAPRPIDLAVICTPAHTVPELVRQCGAAGVGGLLISSAGFREAGAEGRRLEDALRHALSDFPMMRVIGPNCLGVMVPGLGLNATFARTGAQTGGVALISQSGALCSTFLGWAQDESVGFSYFISVGNMVDVGFADLLDYLADCPHTNAVVLYIEAVTEGSRFIDAARRLAACKPVIAYKAGRHPAGAKAAASHTGALAGEDAVYDAVFRECGVIRIDRLDDLLSVAELLGRPRQPLGRRLCVVTNAGGPGVIAADAMADAHGCLADLTDQSISLLNGFLPECWSHGNPVDVIGDASAERLAHAVDVVLDDPGVDAALVILTPQSMIDTDDAARRVADSAIASSKPVLACWMGGQALRQAHRILQQSGVSTYDTPEQAIGAFQRLVQAKWVKSFTAPTLPTTIDPSLQVQVHSLVAGRTGLLSEDESRSVFAQCGIAVLPTLIARTATEAMDLACRLGYPVAMKLYSHRFVHKSEVGGVHLNLHDSSDLLSAFTAIRDSFQKSLPSPSTDAFEGVTLQPMVDRNQGIEFLVGIRRDPVFGPLVVAGAGGTLVEVLADCAIGLAPISPDRARAMLSLLRISPVLNAFRGRGPLDTDSLVHVIVSLSHLITVVPRIREAEINPLLVTSTAATALDARIILAEG